MTLEELVNWATQNKVDFSKPITNYDTGSTLSIRDLGLSDDGGLEIELGA